MRVGGVASGRFCIGLRGKSLTAMRVNRSLNSHIIHERLKIIKISGYGYIVPYLTFVREL